jgi:hypothetical protein
MTALRWLLVLPAALGAYIVLQALFVLLSLLLAVPEALNRGVSQLIADIFCPYYFVYIGSKVAPAFRLHVAVLLTVVLSVLYGMLLLYGVLRGDISYPLWWLTLSLVLGLGSCVFAVVRIQDDRAKDTSRENWRVAVLTVLANIFGIIYIYGYFGQAVLFLSMFWTPIIQNWLNILNPFLYMMTLFGMFFTWYFWVLVATAALGYFGMEFFSAKAAQSSATAIVHNTL